MSALAVMDTTGTDMDIRTTDMAMDIILATATTADIPATAITVGIHAIMEAIGATGVGWHAASGVVMSAGAGN